MLGDFKRLLRVPCNVLPLHLKQTFPPIIWIFIEGDGIKFRLPFRICSTLLAALTAFAYDDWITIGSSVLNIEMKRAHIPRLANHSLEENVEGL